MSSKRNLGRKTANTTIASGFRAHRIGKRVRQGGIALTGGAIGVAGLHAVASHIGSGGRVFDFPPSIINGARNVAHLAKFRNPALAIVGSRYGERVGRAIGRGLDRIARRVKASPRGIGRAQKLWAFGVRHKVPTRSAKAAVVGLGAAALGLAAERFGGRMIQTGFQGHPNRRIGRIKKFFFGR